MLCDWRRVGARRRVAACGSSLKRSATSRLSCFTGNLKYFYPELDVLVPSHLMALRHTCSRSSGSGCTVSATKGHFIKKSERESLSLAASHSWSSSRVGQSRLSQRHSWLNSASLGSHTGLTCIHACPFSICDLLDLLLARIHHLHGWKHPTPGAPLRAGAFSHMSVRPHSQLL